MTKKKGVKKGKLKPVRHHVRKHYHSYKSSPPGIRALIAYSAIVAVVYFFLSLSIPTTFIFGYEIHGFTAQFFNILFFCLQGLMIYGFVQRKPWVWEFSLLWYLFSSISSLFGVIVRSSNIMDILIDSVVLSSLIILAINGMIIWYIYRRKVYFKEAKAVHDYLDKIFIYIITIFFTILILSFSLMVVEFYNKTNRIIDDNLNDIRGSTLEEALFICSDKGQPDRDLCFLTIAVVHPELVERDVCNLIYSNFYRLTCYEALS